MDRPVAEQVFAACENALAELTKIERALHGLEDEVERRDLMKSLSFVIADVLGTIRAPVVRQFPELVTAKEPAEPDDVLNEGDQGIVSTLGPSDLPWSIARSWLSASLLGGSPRALSWVP